MKMKRQLMGLALAGSLGLAGALAPRFASAQDASEDPGANGGPGATETECGPGWHGPGTMGGRGMMGGSPHGAMMEERGGMMGGALSLGPIWRLDLTDAQRAQLRKLAGDFRRANWNTIGSLIDAREKLRDLESAPQPDPKQVGTAFADVSKLRQALLEAGVQARSQALAVLTPAQRQQLETWRKQGPGPHGELRAHGSGMMAP
jgi:Spy/CpxP family protein refolding chaperone